LVPLVVGDESSVAAQEHGLDSQSAEAAAKALSSRRVGDLLRITKALSTASTSQALLSSSKIKDLLQQSGLILTNKTPQADIVVKAQYESDIEWLLVGKATVQTYGLILSTLLDQLIPLSDDIWYWDEVLSSYSYSSLYAVQTSPLRMWAWTKGIYHESRSRLRRLRQNPRETFEAQGLRSSVSNQWSQFYSIVHESIVQRSVSNIQRRILSPVALARAEAQHKQKQLRRLREMTASGLGVLIDEGLSFGVTEDDGKSEVTETSQQEWKGVLERSVALMDMVLRGVLTLDVAVSEFEDKVFAGVEEDPELSIHVEDINTVERPAILAKRLVNLLDTGIPGHVAATKGIVDQNGRPSRLIRYWLPAGLLLISSSTILRILVNRKSDILNWVQDLGFTIRDFWFNWVVDPTRKMIGTIRHDTNSEIAIMSRDSLKADQESLERMVVEFALDNPHQTFGTSSLTDEQLADIRIKVREGDVTPVLRAYEKDLRKPFVGAVRGDLVRSLLIQVQKTKVDLEVAISGIDALLKSQELVFGFVSLTPGVLVSIGLLQYLRTLWGGRKGGRKSHRAGRSVRILRNIDRILSEATPSQNNLLSYKDHGLLVCEVHVLRRLIHGMLPRDIEKEFLEDLDDLANLKGIQVQVKALERIRWAYSKWLW
jgi:nuclear-control-of-ATPase protein 2